MEKKDNKTYAYIDGANIHKGIESLGWKLDYKKFRDFLANKYNIQKAYYFIGDIETNKLLYQNLQEWGYVVVLKTTVPYGKEEVKGNVDVKLTLQAVRDYYEKEYEKAVLITGDGDFLDLVVFLAKKDKLKIVLSPNHKKCSHLLKKHQFEGGKRIYKLGFIEHARNKLEYIKK
ncbi:NYN domain-containing protein [Patescibacteria group bacterium]|nr:NYN domain-containing protein [Patescibacteria group bacterium]